MLTDSRFQRAFGVGGYLFVVFGLLNGFLNQGWWFPAGDLVAVFYPAGWDVLRGESPYGVLFFYGPPWGFILAPFAALPYGAMHLAIIALDFVALWAIAGRSWLRAGWLMWFPLVVTEMGAGQLNILCAAAIVEAQRRNVWPLAVMSWAKLWPALALPLRSWRPFAIATIAVAAITLPWLGWYGEWIAELLENAEDPIAPLVPVPFLLRLPVALALLAWQRPWSRALGAMLASPNLYWGQLVVILAPLALWRLGPPYRDAPDPRASSPAPESVPAT